MTEEQAYITVKLVKSPIGYNKKQKETVKGLGLKKMNSEKRLKDTACTRGMVNKIPHLVRIVSED